MASEKVDLAESDREPLLMSDACAAKSDAAAGEWNAVVGL